MKTYCSVPSLSPSAQTFTHTPGLGVKVMPKKEGQTGESDFRRHSYYADEVDRQIGSNEASVEAPE